MYLCLIVICNFGIAFMTIMMIKVCPLEYSNNAFMTIIDLKNCNIIGIKGSSLIDCFNLQK